MKKFKVGPRNELGWSVVRVRRNRVRCSEGPRVLKRGLNLGCETVKFDRRNSPLRRGVLATVIRDGDFILGEEDKTESPLLLITFFSVFVLGGTVER